VVKMLMMMVGGGGDGGENKVCEQVAFLFVKT
jgi:hypothetical protein